MKKIDKTKAFIIGIGIMVLVLSVGDLYSEADGGHGHTDSQAASEDYGHSD